MTNPDYRGGYSAMVAAHELLHTLGALDTWSAQRPPHACPESPALVCDNELDVMEPYGVTYWLDNTYLDFGYDDYYAHSGSWWDVQDSQWLRHLDAPSYALVVQLGAGAASVASAVPGVACNAGTPCTSTWDAGTSVELTATPSPRL